MELTAISSRNDLDFEGEPLFWDSCVDVVVVVEDDTVLVDFSEAEEFVFEFGGMVTEVGNVGRGYTRLSAVTSIISSV